jgi:adenosylcobinamide-phosphate guanylyltransferase
MGLTALVMAGGEATRMGVEAEKPLLEVGGTSMIQLVIEALRASKNVDRVIVAVSPKSTRVAEKARELGAEVVETPGSGYEQDMKTAIKRLELGDVLVVSADLPFLTAKLVDSAFERYKSSGKPALSVMCPPSVLEKMNLQPPYLFEVEGKKLVPIGVNILDGTRIDEPVLEEATLVTESPQLALNVNKPEELEVARKLAKQQNR